MLPLLAGLVLAGAPGATPAPEGVAVAFHPSISVPAAALLVREGGGEPAPVALERRGVQWVALVPDALLSDEMVWLLAGEGWVSAPVRGRPGVALPVLPAGHLTGTVVASAREQLPTWGWLVLAPADAPAQLPERLPVVLKQGRLSMPVPVGTWRTALEFPGFSRVELGVATVALEGTVVALPSPVALKPAATVGLHLRAQGAAALPGPCRSWLFAASEVDAAQCALAFEGTGAWPKGTLVDRLGGVQLAGGSAGEAFAVVECPPWPPHLLGPLPLEVGEEAMARAEVGPAAAVEVVAPFVAEFLQTHPLNRAILAAYPRATRALSWCAFEAELSSDAEVSLPLLFGGEWELELLAGTREPLLRGALIVKEALHLTPGDRQRLVLPQPPLVRGVVEHGQAGATCLLTFAGVGAAAGERPTWSDSEGRFLVLGAEGGRTQVTARCTRPSLDAFLPEVEVVPGKPLRLALPAGEILAAVVDQKGLPQRGRTLVLQLLDGPGAAHPRWGVQGVRRTSDAAGRARFASLPPGRYRVEVFADTRRRGAAEVTLQEGESRRVVVREQSGVVRLRLRSAAGQPLAGATLWVLAPPGGSEPGLPPGGLALETDAAGEAELSLSAPPSHSLNVMVDAPVLGRVLLLLRPGTVEDEEAVEFVLPPAGGELELLVSAGDLEGPQVAFLVRGDGAYTALPLHPEERWVRAEGEGRWVLGPLGPGSYQLLRLSWAPAGGGPFGFDEFLRAAWAATRAQGSWVTVVPGQRTVVASGS